MLLHPKHGELLLNKLLRPQLVPFGKTLFKKKPQSCIQDDKKCCKRFQFMNETVVIKSFGSWIWFQF